MYSDLIVMSSPLSSSSPQQSPCNELPYVIEAFFVEQELKIIVKDTRFQDQLRSKGFGEKEDSQYLLKPYEALYLIYGKRLNLKGEINNVNFDSLVEVILKQDKYILTKPAKYVVFGINEGMNLGVDDFSQIIKDIGKMGKDAIIAVVERRGEIIYYKVSTMHFSEIKNF
jgi:tRNA-intron endonuclease